MTLFAILSAHGFTGPFSADYAQPGTVRDAHNRPIPFLIVPGVMDCQARREFSRVVAEQLSREAGEAATERDAA